MKQNYFFISYLLLKILLSYKNHYVKLKLSLRQAQIAQLVEQWIEDPRVTSSNLVLGI